MGIVVEVINELENFHITKEALEVCAFFSRYLHPEVFDGEYTQNIQHCFTVSEGAGQGLVIMVPRCPNIKI
jgi:hypothetical protein